MEVIALQKALWTSKNFNFVIKFSNKAQANMAKLI